MRPGSRRRAEWGWALGWAGLLAVVTALPYLWALTTCPFGLRYLGFVFNPDEPNVHLSWIRQAADGAVLLRNNFTSEPHVGHFLNLFMLAAGCLAHGLGLTPYQAWATLRVCTSVALPLVCYWAVLGFTADRQLRRLALMVMTTSSGLGWYWLRLADSGLCPVDVDKGLVMPEAITFLSLYLNPLFAGSMALLLGAMVLGERALRAACPRRALGAGALGLLLANIHTYDSIPLLLVLTAWFGILCAWRRAWCWRRFGCWALIVACVLPAMGWQAHLIHSDALYAAKANTITASPSLATMAVSYGLLWPLALVGAVQALRKRREAVVFWVLWAALHFACAYLPTSVFPFQRKMLEGFHLPLAMLAASGLQGLARRASRLLAWEGVRDRLAALGPLWALRVEVAARRRRWTRLLSGAAALALVPSNLVFVASTLANVAHNNQAKAGALMPPFALPEADYAALEWLAANTPRHAVVLGLPYAMNYLPGLTGRNVFLGHWAETIGFSEKVKAWKRFMSAVETREQKRASLRAAGITHVFVGSYELASLAADESWRAELPQVYPREHFKGPGVRIYEVPATN